MLHFPCRERENVFLIDCNLTEIGYSVEISHHGIYIIVRVDSSAEMLLYLPTTFNDKCVVTIDRCPTYGMDEQQTALACSDKEVDNSLWFSCS